MPDFLNFPSCHVHQESLDTASTPKHFRERELELGTGVLTVTDHGTLGACRVVYDLAREKSLIPILGLEGYLRDDNCPILAAKGIEKDAKGTYSSYNKYYHFTMHALDQAAYEAMCRVLSRVCLNRVEQHGQEAKPMFAWADLAELGQFNVTLTSGCLVGLVQRHLIKERPDIAIEYYKMARSLVKPGNFYVEVFPHRTSHQWVNASYINLEDGRKLQYWSGKKVRTDKAKEITLEALAKAPRGHTQLLGVKNRNAWDEFSPPIGIVSVEKIQDFLPNECTPFAPDGDTQRSCNRFMLAVAARFKDPVLISDDAHFANPDEKIIQDCRLGGSGDTWKFYESYHRQSSAEAFRIFQETLGIPEDQFRSWLENSQTWAQRFKDFTLVQPVSLPTKFYPQDTIKHIKTLIDKHGRMDWKNSVWVQRLQEEIQLLHSNGKIDLLPYFMLGEEVNDFYTKHEKITGPGRGSAAGLLLAYTLGITHINPLKYGLSRERFITLDRIQSGKLPDIDQDLCSRDILVDTENGFLPKRFGDHFAQISTATVLRLKSSMKDISRALRGEVAPDINKAAAMLPDPPQGVSDHDFVFGYVADDGREVRGLIDISKELQEYTQKYPRDWAIVKKTLGLTRNRSRHACGFIIANRPIHEFIPVAKISDTVCTQYTAPSVEASGGVKMDYLVVNSLRDIGDCISLVQNRKGVEKQDFVTLATGHVPWVRVIPHNGKFYDVWDLPEDQAVFNDVATGRTETVFQFNTDSAKQWLKEFNFTKPNGHKLIDSIEAMSAFTALDRPGPLDAVVGGRNMLQEYAARVRGDEAIESIPLLQELLPETKGIMVYQEQLQKIYQHLTGCTGSEAEEFRSNVAKKKMEKVNKAYGFFFENASKKIGEHVAKQLWDTIVTWGQYGFNLSVAADTILEFSDGTKRLDEARPGDRIFGVNDVGEVIETEVVALHDHGILDGYEVEFDDGYRIVVSRDHKFLTAKGMMPIWRIVETEEEILGIKTTMADEVWADSGKQGGMDNPR